ncbi:MAG: molybdopterin oxidoreductase family protein, partial [Acidimicrobiales bacterium]
ARGLDAAGILAAAAEGRIQALVLLGADPVADFPDRQLARQALAGAGFVIAVDTFLTASSRQADLVLPAAAYAERSGTTTNIEGRITRLGQKVVPSGLAWPDWMIANELAARLGADPGFESVADIWDEIERVVPSHAGITRAVLATAAHRDGVVAPFVDEGGAEPTGPAAAATDTNVVSKGEATGVDPMATPGLLEAEAQGVPATAVAAIGETGDDGSAGDAASAPPRPAPLRFVADTTPVPVPKLDSYSLRLVSARQLYGHGTTVQASPALAALAAAPTVAAHPSDLAQLGLTSGGRLRLRSPRGTVVAEAVPDTAVPRGSLWFAFNAPCGFGEGPGELIDAKAAVTDVRLETLAGDAAPAGGTR